VALLFLSMLPGQISYMASVVLIWTPNFENGSSRRLLHRFRSRYSVGFRFVTSVGVNVLEYLGTGRENVFVLSTSAGLDIIRDR
jgi:hypothetical protein